MLIRRRRSSVLRRRSSSVFKSLSSSVMRRRSSSVVRRRRLSLSVCQGRLKGATWLLLLYARTRRGQDSDQASW
jgi:hypothetical protein